MLGFSKPVRILFVNADIDPPPPLCVLRNRQTGGRVEVPTMRPTLDRRSRRICWHSSEPDSHPRHGWCDVRNRRHRVGRHRYR